MNSRAYSILSLFDGSKSSYGSDYSPRSRGSNNRSLSCSAPDNRSRGTSPELPRLISMSSTLSIGRAAIPDSVQEFVIPTRRTSLRSARTSATAELMAYLDRKTMRDYNAVIKKEMEGENVSSIKRRIGYDNVKVFELNKSFPQYQSADFGSMFSLTEGQ